MKRCRDRKYDGCNQLVADEYLCCPYCGGDLVSEQERSNTTIGAGSAISGGVHSSDDHSKEDSDNVVNSHNITHTNSHNTTNNTTIYEATKSEDEKLKDAEYTYRIRCKTLFRDGLISNEGENQLRELQVKLNLADELILPIKEEVRRQSKTRKTQLSLTGLSDIRQTKSIIEQNTAPALQRQLIKLESWMQEYDDNTLKLMYYQMSSMLEPIRYTNRYEDSAKDEYWEVYWAYVAYLLQNRERQANEALASLGRWHAYYPEQNDTILLLVGRLMLNEPLEDIRQARNQLSAHFTPDLQLLLAAIDELLEMDWAKESICIRPAHSFYITTLFGHFVETQRIAGAQRLKERREQEEVQRKEEEQIRQAELNLQNQIRNQKTSILQKFQETGRIEIACQEVGIGFHEFNTWLEEDRIFASSYNELVHCMEVRKYEEVEQRHKQQALELETKQKKTQFKVLFEQNKCDLLRTCSEVGISSADYQEWRRVDRVFNDEINYIVRENNKIADRQYRQKRAKIVKKTGAIMGAIIILLIIGFGVKVAIDNKINEAKAAEEARIEQEENRKREIATQHSSLIDEFNNALGATVAEIDKAIKNSSYLPNVGALDYLLISLEKSLTEVQRFESSNLSISDPQYELLREQCIDMCGVAIKSLREKYTSYPRPANSNALLDMKTSVESFKNNKL